MTSQPSPCRLAFRLVAAGTLAAILWKLPFFALSARVYAEWPVDTRLFPDLFEWPALFLAAYAGAVAALGALLVVPARPARLAGGGVALVSLSILCVHVGSYNDATFTTAWWATIWLFWYAAHMDEGQVALQRASRLSCAIVSVILLGGAVGKWTEEYWSGQVLHAIYFVDRDFWFFNLVRASADAETVRTLATGYSRAVILLESGCGLGLWLLPARTAAWVGMSVSVGIAVFSNFNLFSVVLSMGSLAAVGLLVPRYARRCFPTHNPAATTYRP